MPASSFIVFVHQSLAKDVSENLVARVGAARVSTFSGQPPAVFKDASLRWDDESIYQVIVAPISWLKTPVALSPEIKKRVARGMLRFVFWNADDSPREFGAPASFVRASNAREAEFFLNHISRLPGWGVQTTVAKKSRILTERISDEKQIARKIEQSIDFICDHRPLFTNRTLELRACMTNMFAAAIAPSLAAKGGKPPVFQIGIGEDSFVFSLRWKMTELEFEKWREPKLSWAATFALSYTNLVQLCPDAGEVEVQLLFCNETGPSFGMPQAIDILSCDRMAAGSGMLNEMNGFSFDYFQIEDKGEKTTFASAAPDVASAPSAGAAGGNVAGKVVIQDKIPPAQGNPQIELDGLRIEYKKIEKQNRSLQELVTENTRKIGQMVEADKRAKEEIAALQLRATNAKQKEDELIKKLAQAMESIRQLKSSSQQAS